MTLTDFVERVGRTIFEAPFGGGAPRTANHAELAEIRHAILAEIERKSYRSGGRESVSRITVSRSAFAGPTRSRPVRSKAIFCASISRRRSGRRS